MSDKLSSNDIGNVLAESIFELFLHSTAAAALHRDLVHPESNPDKQSLSSRWRQFVFETHGVANALKLSARAVDAAMEKMSPQEIELIEKILAADPPIRRKNIAEQLAKVDKLPTLFPKPEQLGNVANQVEFSEAKLKVMPDFLAKAANQFETRLREKLLRVTSNQHRLDGLQPAAIAWDQLVLFDHEPGHEEPKRSNCLASEIILLVCAVVVLIVVFVIYIQSRPLEDNRRRREIDRAYQRGDLAGYSDDYLLNSLELFLDGPTLNGDERAILQILEAIGCSRMTAIWNQMSSEDITYGQWFLEDFHGSEFAELMELVVACGIWNFRSWDDDASREFINGVDETVLWGLSNSSRNQLIRNLFEGFTGDADERAVYRLMYNMSCDDMIELLEMSGSRYEDFDDNIHGAEWTSVRGLITHCQSR